MPREPTEEEKSEDAEKRAKTPYDLARVRLERLTENINKPAPIPEPKRARAPPKPPEFVRNVVGSSAAAGSAEFHIFRNNRRREMLRVEHMEKEANAEESARAFQEKQEERRKQADELTAKKRQKRQKRKMKQRELRKLKKTKTANDQEDSSSVSDASEEGSDKETTEKTLENDKTESNLAQNDSQNTLTCAEKVADD